MNCPEQVAHRNGDFSHAVTAHQASARLCETCGSDLVGRPTRTRRFCSDACRQDAYRERKERGQRRSLLDCLGSWMATSRRRYCRDACKTAAARERREAEAVARTKEMLRSI